MPAILFVQVIVGIILSTFANVLLWRSGKKCGKSKNTFFIAAAFFYIFILGIGISWALSPLTILIVSPALVYPLGALVNATPMLIFFWIYGSPKQYEIRKEMRKSKKDLSRMHITRTGSILSENG